MNRTAATEHAPAPRPFVSRVRGAANVLTLLGAITLVIGWAIQASVFFMARVGLITITTFIISFIAIAIENRQTADEPDPGNDPTAPEDAP